MFGLLEVDHHDFTFVGVELHVVFFGPSFNKVDCGLGLTGRVALHDLGHHCVVDVLPCMKLGDPKVVDH